MNYPDAESLQTLVERLEKSYYDCLNALCNTAQKYAQKLKDLEVQRTTSQYVTSCSRLLEDVQKYVKVKKEYFIPYLKSVAEKESEQHDCSNCTGGCNVQHDLQIRELRMTHLQLKDIINRVQMVSLPLYSETIYPDVYRLLRNHMALIENSLTELFSFEETRLIPGITAAQKKINARI